MKNKALAEHLKTEADRFKRLAETKALESLHKGDGRNITELDARMIRDHEIRAETYRTCATLAANG
jgi:hypothetical protein